MKQAIPHPLVTLVPVMVLIGIGIVNLTAYLIGETCREINALVVCIDVDTTGVFGNGAAEVGDVTIVDDTVLVYILEFDHTGDGVLSFRTGVGVVGNSRVVYDVLRVRNAVFQRPYSIYNVEVVNSIETGTLETLDGSNGHALNAVAAAEVDA